MTRIIARALLRALLAAGALTLSASACLAAPQEIRIGGLFDLSAAGADWGSGERDAFLMALEDFKAANPHIKVRSFMDDSAYSNIKSVSAAQALISVNNVSLLVGPTWETFNAVIPVCETRKVVCVAPSSNEQGFSAADPKFSFTLWFDNREYAKALVREAKAQLVKRAALISETSPYYDTLHDTVKSSFSGVVYAAQTPPKLNDFRSIISHIPTNLGSIFVFLLGDGSMQAFLKQWVELREDRPTIYTDDNILYLSPKVDLSSLNLKIVCSRPSLSGGRSDEFPKLFSARYGRNPPSPSTSIAYDSTILLLTCAKESKSRIDTADCIRRAQHYSGFSGEFSMDGGQRALGRQMEIAYLN